MTGPGDWVTPSQNVSAPPFLDSNSAGIILGPDVPPCMATTYSAVWRFQPLGAATGGLDAPPSLYFGQSINSLPGGSEIVDVGYLVYDGASVCGFMVIMRYNGQNRIDGTGTIWATTQFGGFRGPSTLAQFKNEYNFGDTSGAIGAFLRTVEVNFNKGDPLVRQPNPANVLWTVDSVSMGRGLRASAGSAVSSAAVQVEAVVLTTNSNTFFDGRCYEWDAVGSYQQSGAGFWILNLRQTNLAGNLIGQAADLTPVGSGVNRLHRGRFRNVSGAAITCPVAMTLAFSTGGQTVQQIANGITPRTLYVRDCGAATDYPNEPTLI